MKTNNTAGCFIRSPSNPVLISLGRLLVISILVHRGGYTATTGPDHALLRSSYRLQLPRRQSEVWACYWPKGRCLGKSYGAFDCIWVSKARNAPQLTTPDAHQCCQCFLQTPPVACFAVGGSTSLPRPSWPYRDGSTSRLAHPLDHLGAPSGHAITAWVSIFQVLFHRWPHQADSFQALSLTSSHGWVSLAWVCCRSSITALNLLWYQDRNTGHPLHVTLIKRNRHLVIRN